MRDTNCDSICMGTLILIDAQLLQSSLYHYTKKYSCPCVRPSMRACVQTGVHRKRDDPKRRKKLCFFAKLKSGAATRDSRTQPATVLTLD